MLDLGGKSISDRATTPTTATATTTYTGKLRGAVQCHAEAAARPPLLRCTVLLCGPRNFLAARRRASMKAIAGFVAGPTCHCIFTACPASNSILYQEVCNCFYERSMTTAEVANVNQLAEGFSAYPPQYEHRQTSKGFSYQYRCARKRALCWPWRGVAKGRRDQAPNTRGFWGGLW